MTWLTLDFSWENEEELTDCTKAMIGSLFSVAIVVTRFCFSTTCISDGLLITYSVVGSKYLSFHSKHHRSGLGHEIILGKASHFR